MNERIHDVHGFLGDTDVWVYLLKNFVDIDGESLDSSSSSFLISFGSNSFWGSFFFCHLNIMLIIKVSAQIKLKVILSSWVNPLNLIG